MRQLFISSMVDAFSASLPASADKFTLSDSRDLVWKTPPDGVSFESVEVQQ